MGFLQKTYQHSLEGLLAIGILASQLVSSQYAYTTTNVAIADEKKDGIIDKKQERLPHYLRGIDVPSDPVLNLFEKWRVYDSQTTKYPDNKQVAFLNESIQISKNIHGKNVTLTFVNYVSKDNIIRHYTADGTEDLSQDEFNLVVEDQANYLETAVRLTYEEFSDLQKNVLLTVESTLKKEGRLAEGKKLEDLLDQQIQGYKDLKIRDAFFIPDITIQDFVPTHYYFGPNTALGVTYLNTGLISIDPKGRILDYIAGKPLVAMHELVHANKKLENYPFALYFAAELWAELSILADTDYTDFTFHPYLKDVRKLSKMLFNFDSAVEFEDIKDFSLVIGTKLEDKDDYKRLREKIETARRISATIKKTALDEFLPEFYANPLYWVTVNEFLNDDSAAFKIYFYKKYEPTCLGGPEKTRQFMEENKAIVREESEKVLHELQQEKQNPEAAFRRKEEVRKELTRFFASLDPETKKAMHGSFANLGLTVNEDSKEFISLLMKLYSAGLMDENKLLRIKRELKK